MDLLEIIGPLMVICRLDLPQFVEVHLDPNTINKGTFGSF